ncbi:MAG: addiction module protein [Candidatus Riflebacteria bacterium]|nr:addiction module protein [Candidatus Riflebacteria bacterium]
MGMKGKANELLKAAMELAPGDRAELAVEIIASIDGMPDADADAAWAIELERRARAAHDGVSRGKDLASVRDRIERELKR